MEILVCDDYQSGFDAVQGAIGDRYSPRRLVGQELRKELEGLFKRVSRSLSNKRTRAGKLVAMGGIFDEADVVVIDNNLAALDLAGTRLTAEALIGFVRAFTEARYVVSLNKNPDVDFDLRYLVGDYQSHADVALNTGHLSSDALWAGHGAISGGIGEFAPWYWPNLPQAFRARGNQIRRLESGGLDESVVEVLAFDIESIGALSRRARGPLSLEAEDESALRNVTILDFFRNACRALPAADRERLADWAEDPEDVAARRWVSCLVAADLEKWIRRDVLGPQDVLVDLPHLLIRMPFLLGGEARVPAAWNKVLAEREPPFGLVSRFFEGHLADARFGAGGTWLESPCFWWPRLKANEELNDLFFNSEGEWADVVFCEDVSCFRTVADSESNAPVREGAHAPVEFEAEFEGTWTRRYVARVPGRQYSPQSRFAL